MEKLEKYNHVDLLFPGKYLKAADLRGKHVVVTIDKIDPRGELQMRGGKKESKPIVYLRGKEKAWVLNVTNARTIAAIYGPEVTKWTGKSITIYPARVAFGGKETDAIRVEDRAPNGNGKSAEPRYDEPAHDPETGEVFDYGPPPMTDEEIEATKR